ncbi:hypothetical protein ACIP2X_15165 [Streptomyces sp. NPDC089424]|uniref:lytic transglycosylase domain-containing protein n=1 Tax=Streptomyces sp. NPDC089424 TaxID=3365917 RepID=UPI00381EBEC8
MSRPLTRPFHEAGERLRGRRGLRGSVVATVATVATALLTAGSQAPGHLGAQQASRDGGMSVPGGFVPPDAALPEVRSQGDDSYHVELPPLKDVEAVEKVWGEEAAKPAPRRVGTEAGLPSTVFAAYRRATASVGRTDPSCRLRWELLAAIGKVESGHASGGAVDADGDTLTRITGPALDGNGFALILDSEGGRWDGDAVYDRAVGPLQFLPTTWKTWGADGNGDGTANPNNIFDAALAAGHYLCAGERDLGTAAGLERAILSYNYSRDYLNLVLGWMEFYLRGVHAVPDGTGVVPESPGAGSGNPATRPVTEAGNGGGGGAGGGNGNGNGNGGSGGGATAAPGGSTSPEPPTPSDGASPGSTPGPSSTPGDRPSDGPTPTGTPGDTAAPTPGESPSETTTPDPEPSTEAPASPSPGETTGSPESPEPTSSDTTALATG